jgi:D-alanine-D-alanine ligase
MKVAVVYNRESKNVINLFGLPNREKYGQKAIARIVAALKKGGHQVISLEGDKDLVPKLEEYMPRVVKGERPGMVFNLSYGIQGQARYTHVPGILEMMGLPYVGSGPLAHSLALDKVVAKVLFRQNDVPTPEFCVLKEPEFDTPPLEFPMIVKPKNESTSFGLEIVHDEIELRRAAGVIFKQFGQAVLVEEYIDGREINVGLIGSSPASALPPAELVFEEGPKIYTLQDKRAKNDRRVRVVCPADLPPELAQSAQRIARDAFEALGCADCARVDLRLSPEGKLYVLEINSLPSLGEHGSFSQAAVAAGLDFTALINRLVEVASARYFGTPQPPRLNGKRRDRGTTAFVFLTRNRDRLEETLRQWTRVWSRTEDPIGQDAAYERLAGIMEELGLHESESIQQTRTARLWETEKGYEGGTLVLGHIDVPIPMSLPRQSFRREPEWISGEGVGTSRGSLAMLELALRAARSARALKGSRLGVLYYGDEGRDCRYSTDIIARAAARAGRVLVLRPVGTDGRIVTGRRGVRAYRLMVEGDSIRIGGPARKGQLMAHLFQQLAQLADLTDRKARVAVVVTDLRLETFPQRVPHAASVAIRVSYPTTRVAARIDRQMREILDARRSGWRLDLIADRPPMPERRANIQLAEELARLADRWEIPLIAETSVIPSVAGLVPRDVPVLCGLGAVAEEINTPQERVSRISLVQRTLLLAQLLVAGSPRKAS